MKTLKYYLQKAQREQWAIGQFNFSDFTQMKAIVNAAQKCYSPIILGTSEGESKFFGLDEAVALRNILRKKLCLPVFLNLDHGKTFKYLKEAIRAGYDMVHIDASKLTLEENIKITKEVVRYAKWRGIIVEGEVGRIGNDSSKIYSEKFVINENDLTNSNQAKEYVDQTKVNLLAVSIGNFHGIEVSGIDPDLRMDVLRAVKEKTNKTLLTLHGGSGTHDEDIKEAIKNGIVKININTELRLAFSGNLRRALSSPEEITPYKFLVDAKNSVQKVVERKITLFGSLNKV